jgi:hypothetical protein
MSNPTIPVTRPASLPIPGDIPDVVTGLAPASFNPPAIPSQKPTTLGARTLPIPKDSIPLPTITDAPVKPPAVTSQPHYPYRPQPEFTPTSQT